MSISQLKAHEDTKQIPVWDTAGALLWGGERGRCGGTVSHIGCGGVWPRRTLRIETKIH